MNSDETTTATWYSDVAFPVGTGRSRKVCETYEVQHASPDIDPHFF
jgi:hypothetical protein